MVLDWDIGTVLLCTQHEPTVAHVGSAIETDIDPVENNNPRRLETNETLDPPRPESMVDYPCH
jgi:hypothetical protein